MGSLFVGGVIAGLAIAVPVGPIGVLLVDRALRQGFATAAVAGLGAATADLLYAALAVTVGTAVAELIDPALTPLRVVAVAALLWIAVRNLRGAFATAEVGDPPKVKPSRVYATFLGLTILNPATMIYFASLIVGLDIADESEPAKAFFVLGAFVGSAGWQILLAGGGAIAGAKMGDRVRTVTSVFGSLVIVGLAIQMATRI
jgi:threonine/homoserine/homoserine lactone efflux protein